jgi:hypothetical protein
MKWILGGMSYSDKFKSRIRRLIEKGLEHAVGNLIVYFFLNSFVAILIYLTSPDFLNLINSTIPIWVILLAIFIFLPAIFLLAVFISKSRKGIKKDEKGPLCNRVGIAVSGLHYLIHWQIYQGTQFKIELFFGKSESRWINSISGPFCTSCATELVEDIERIIDRLSGGTKTRWRCPNCNTNFITNQSKLALQSDMEKIVQGMMNRNDLQIRNHPYLK